MTRREHIEQVAAELNATIEHIDFRYGSAVNTRTRTLLLAWDVAPEEEAYWVALHELGHLALTDQDEFTHTMPRAGSAGALFGVPDWDAEREAQAWVWAMDKAIFPLDQAGESSIAWGLADRLHYDFKVGPALELIYRRLGDEPDWYFNVTEPEHYAKLDGYAKPNWARLAAAIKGSGVRASRRRELAGDPRT